MIDETKLAAALSAVPLAQGRFAPPRVKDTMVSVMLDVTGLDAGARATLQRDVEAALRAVPGVAAVRVGLNAERTGRTIIAVASGKGGVGKSTVSANLAVALARLGHKVGLVDADIYGPSQARLLGTEGEKPQARDKQLLPIQSRFGVAMLSMAHLVESGRAIAWRGPMASNALKQMIEADWGDASIIVVDMPPGTGDVQLSMIQQHKPTGVVIVSTPQDLALIDATRAIDLFTQAGVPILGLIENMAGYACPHCGENSDPFGAGGAQAAAANLNIPFLGKIPLEIAIRSASDAGSPPADTAEDTVFRPLAETLATQLQAARASSQV